MRIALFRDFTSNLLIDKPVALTSRSIVTMSRCGSNLEGTDIPTPCFESEIELKIRQHNLPEAAPDQQQASRDTLIDAASRLDIRHDEANEQNTQCRHPRQLIKSSYTRHIPRKHRKIKQVKIVLSVSAKAARETQIDLCIMSATFPSSQMNEYILTDLCNKLIEKCKTLNDSHPCHHHCFFLPQVSAW